MSDDLSDVPFDGGPWIHYSGDPAATVRYEVVKIYPDGDVRVDRVFDSEAMAEDSAIALRFHTSGWQSAVHMDCAQTMRYLENVATGAKKPSGRRFGVRRVEHIRELEAER